MPTPVLIKCCLNGGRSKDQHPAVPVTPAEIAAAAIAVRDAGAGAVHVHPRGADGNQSNDPDDIGRAIETIREACPGMPVGATTILSLYENRDVAARLRQVERWKVRPDFVSCNWFEDGAVDLAELLLSMGVGVEAGLTTVDNARVFAEGPIAGRAMRVLVEVADREGVDGVATTTAIDAVLDGAGNTVPRLHHGFNLMTWAIIENAFRIGRDVRVGLEDTRVLPDGSTTRDNAELVTTAVELARRNGREPIRVG
jgi:uncharacterized protein (DUF849 family)